MKKKLHSLSLRIVLLISVFWIWDPSPSTAYGEAYRQKKVLEQSISISLPEGNLEESLQRIKSHTGISFAYDPSILKLESYKVPAVSFQEAPLARVLNKLLFPANIGYKEVNGTIVLQKQGQPRQEQQQRTITGTISDENGEGLPGVAVVLKGTTRGTTTDVAGNYSLVVSEENAVLAVSFLGYKTQEIQVGDRDRVDISLAPDSKALDEVVVVGYMQQSREETIASVASLKSEELDRIPSSSPIQALQGKLAGVSVPVTSGQPGANPEITIRGGTSLDGKGSPLVIVDGVFRDFADVNPNDIESLQVLKDAASTAAYGARGANGVIVIKTKNGATGQKPVVTFRYQSGIETQAREYEYLNAADYLVLGRKTWAAGKDMFDINTKLYVSGNSVTVPTYTQKGQYGKALYTPAYLQNLLQVEGQEYVDNLLAQGWQTIDDPVNPGNTIIFYDNEYQDMVWNTAHTQNYDFSVGGGTDKSNYYVSLGYIDQGGVYLGTGYKRFSGTANFGVRVSDRFKLNTNLSYLWNDNRYVQNATNTLIRGTRITPLHRIFDDNGNPLPGEYISVRYRPHELEGQDIDNNTDQVTLRLAGELDLIEGLSYRPSVALYMNNFSGTYFEKYFSIQSRPRDKSQTSNNARTLMLDQILQYDKTLGTKHNLTLLAGANYTRETGLNFRGTGQRSTTDYITTFTGDPVSSVINGQTVPNFSIASSYGENATLSFFGQFNYDYEKRFLLSGSLRRDGFSNFAPNNRYATFPSIAAGWNIHNERFWNVNFVNQLKVRSSFGETGMSSLSYRDTYGGYGSYTYAATGGILRTSLPNPNLVWETTQMFDAGLDLGFLNGRINATLDFYNKVTRDRLASLPMPSESGFGSIKYNVGKMQNRGFEVALGATALHRGDFSWDIAMTYAYNQAKVLELPDNGREKNRIGGGLVYDPVLGREVEVGGYAEGERPLGIWAFKSNGIFATDQEAKESPIKDLMVSSAALGKPKNAGDVNWADLNGDNLIDSRDVVFMGYRTPDKIGGMQNTFKYKGFTVRVALDYALGHVISNGALARSMGSARAGNEGAVSFALSDKVWQQDGDKDAIYPRFSFGDSDHGFKNHLRRVANDVGTGNGYATDVDFYFSKGDFLAFREVSIKYELPETFASRIKASAIELNAGVHNIGYLTAYDGLNPEVYTGYDPGEYPRPRQFTFGATVKF